MQAFDPRSIILITFFVTLLQALILGALARAMPRQIPGLRYGVLAAALWALGAGLVTVRGIAPAFASVYLGNLALSSAAALMYGALKDLRHGAPLSKRVIWVAVAFYAVLLWIAFISRSYHFLLMTITGFNAFVYFCAAAVSWRRESRGFAPWFLTFILGYAFAVSLARFVTLFLDIENPSHLYDTVSFQRLYLGLVALSVISILLAYTLVAYDRVRGLLERSNAGLEAEVRERTMQLSLEIERKMELERQVSTTADAERRRVGRELHDDLGQRLTGVSLLAEALRGSLTTKDPGLAGHAEAIQSAASDAIAQVRRLARGLMPVGPDAGDLNSALKELARSTSLGNVECVFDHAKGIAIKDQDIATNLYRIAQEAVSNAIRHGRATRVSIRLDQDDDAKIRLTIADNGIGFDLLERSESKGAGLGTIEFRASVIAFHARFESTPGRGSAVSVAAR